MKVQLGWLREYVELPETEHEVAERLTAIGLTVDAVSGEGDAAVLELDIGANRCDAMSHVGVARELAVAFSRELRMPVPDLVEDIEPVDSATSVTVEAADLCPRYAARVVRDLRVGPSPAWMSERLEACGIRPINVSIDVTNYVLLELGHPLHAFDLDLLEENRIVVRRATPGERLETLDGLDRELWPEALLIADASRGVALAGVMGGANTEIRDSTTEVLLESAWFDPVSIRRSSKRVGLHTEASHRFERGADFDAVPLALDRAAELLVELAGGRVLAGRLDVSEPEPPQREVALRHHRLHRLVGAEIPSASCEKILTALGFQIVARDDEGWRFAVPRRRHDVSLEPDLIEEVLRHWGHERIPLSLPPTREGARPRQPWELALAGLRRCLVAAGYHQAVSFSFGDPRDFELWAGSLGEDHPGRQLELKNPMAENLSVMQTSLVPGLLRAASLAARREETELRLFEEAAIDLRRPARPEGAEGFAGAGGADSPVEERRVLAMVAMGHAGPRHFLHAPAALDLLTLKGALLDALVAAAGAAKAARIRVVAEERPNCAAGSSAGVHLDGRRIGWLGRVHPEVLAPLEIAVALHAAEVDLEALLPEERWQPDYRPVSRYPKAVRDLSVLVDRNRSYGDIIAAVEELRRSPDGEAIEAVELVDRYLGKGVPEGKVSLTFSVTYRRGDRTLTQDEVEGLHQRLLEPLIERFGAELRS